MLKEKTDFVEQLLKSRDELLKEIDIRAQESRDLLRLNYENRVNGTPSASHFQIQLTSI